MNKRASSAEAIRIIISEMTVVHPQLHDGRIVGVFVQERRDARLFVCNDQGVRYTICLREITSLRANDFREGNIILAVNVYVGAECRDQKLREMLGVSEFDSTAESAFQKLRNRVTCEPLILVEVSPSYGCDFLAICREVAFLEGYVFS